MTPAEISSNCENCETTPQVIEEFSGTRRNPSIWSCDFEAAIAATGFGKFNIYLIIVALFTGLIAAFETRSMAYIVPAAQCDLHLDIHQKALLNSVPFAGMVLTSCLWGFMGDTLGRRRLIIIICFLDCICWLLATVSQSFEILLLARFLGGMVSSGIYPSLASYLTEMHGVKHRAVMQLFLGNIFGVGDLLLPMLALTVLTKEYSFQIQSLNIHPWNIYLFICALPPLVSGIGFYLLPESPRFYMSKSQDHKAINVFQSIYTININKSTKEDYPVKSLKTRPVDTEIDTQRKQNQASNFFHQIGVFCGNEHLKNIVVVVLAEGFIMMGLNSILLWLPQILQEMSNHQRNFNGTASVCETLNDLKAKKNGAENICEEDMSQNTKIYVCCMLVATATLLTFAISGIIIDKIGKKKLLYLLGVITAISTIILIYCVDFVMTMIFASIICAFGNIGFNALVAIVVDIFPTNLRAMSVSFTMMIGKLGGALGCFVFPIFLQFGCEPPLMVTACFPLVAIVLVYLLPDTRKAPLE